MSPKRTKILPKSKVRTTVPLDVLKARRDCCKQCIFCTKSSLPKFASFLGLSHTSKCKKANKLISTITEDASFSCPEHLFVCLSKEPRFLFAMATVLLKECYKKSQKHSLSLTDTFFIIFNIFS